MASIMMASGSSSIRVRYSISRAQRINVHTTGCLIHGITDETNMVLHYNLQRRTYGTKMLQKPTANKKYVLNTRAHVQHSESGQHHLMLKHIGQSRRQILGQKLSCPSTQNYDCYFLAVDLKTPLPSLVSDSKTHSRPGIYTSHPSTRVKDPECRSQLIQRLRDTTNLFRQPEASRSKPIEPRALSPQTQGTSDRDGGLLMSPAKATEQDKSSVEPAQHKPLVVGLKKPQPQTTNTPATMATADQAPALNEEIQQNVASNTGAAAPAAGTEEAGKPKKKEKGPKAPKPPKAPATPAAPISPALVDLRVGHILRAIAHPNADSLYVSTIAMGDPEGTDHTQIDEETGKVVRTVCSGLKGYIPLEDMQDRKIIVVANLKPVNMRSIKSAAMVLAASPKPEEGADPHAPDRSVELVDPPAGSEAGDKVYFEGWPYGEGKGPEKQLNPKKKQWEAVQPGFYTTDDLTVVFDASLTEEVSGSDKGTLIVEGKGKCTVPSLKGALVR